MRQMMEAFEEIVNATGGIEAFRFELKQMEGIYKEALLMGAGDTILRSVLYEPVSLVEKATLQQLAKAYTLKLMLDIVESKKLEEES